MAELSVALDEARSLLNDAAGTLWTDAVLLPFAKKAHREMQLDLFNSGLPVLRESTAALTVVAGATVLAGQPTDLVEPIEMSERTPGSSEQFYPMAERMWTPNTDQTTTLRFWVWREEVISFLGSTTNREVQLRYWKGLTVPTAAASPIGLILGEVYIGPRTASIAAMSVGNTTLRDIWKADSEEIIDKILRFNIKGQQALPVRRKPYRPRRGLW